MLLVVDILLHLLVLLRESLNVDLDLFYFLFALLSGVPNFVLFVMQLSFDVDHVLYAALRLRGQVYCVHVKLAEQLLFELVVFRGLGRR